jgi:hypothetical protein
LIFLQPLEIAKGARGEKVGGKFLAEMTVKIFKTICVFLVKYTER